MRLKIAILRLAAAAVLMVTHAAVTWQRERGHTISMRKIGALYDHVPLTIHRTALSSRMAGHDARGLP